MQAPVPREGATEHGGLADAPTDLLPFSGMLEKKSALLGFWQARHVEVDRGRLRYFKDGCKEARSCFGQGDVVGVTELPPVDLLLQVRLPGGEERPLAFRAAETAVMRLWAARIRVAFDLEPEVVTTVEVAKPKAHGHEMLEKSASSKAFDMFGRVAGGLTVATAEAVSKVAKATGTEDWLDDRIGSAMKTTARWRERLAQQMDDALTSCDDGKTEMLLDTALASDTAMHRLPACVQRAARRTAGRNLRDATVAEDPKRLKGALLAARRLQATNVPEFEIAVAKYKEVRRMPSDWDVSRMVQERQRGKAKLLTRPDVSKNYALRSLVQLMFDATFRGVVTRDRKGMMPAEYVVEQVAEVQNEAQWLDYLVRRDAVAAEISGGEGPPDRFFSADVATAGPLEIAKAVANSDPMRAKVPHGRRPGELVCVESGHSRQRLRVSIPEGCEGMLSVQESLAHGLPGPSLEATANEVWLFHGCKPIAAKCITSDDFKLDLAGSSSGTLYGRGIYLAENSTKADEYSHQDAGGLYTMLLCRTTLGRLFYSAEVAPDPRKCEDACLKGDYHAVLGDRRACRGTFREFVVFDEDQVYPSYIVSYRRVMPLPTRRSVPS